MKQSNKLFSYVQNLLKSQNAPESYILAASHNVISGEKMGEQKSERLS